MQKSFCTYKNEIWVKYDYGGDNEHTLVFINKNIKIISNLLIRYIILEADIEKHVQKDCHVWVQCIDKQYR